MYNGENIIRFFKLTDFLYGVNRDSTLAFNLVQYFSDLIVAEDKKIPLNEENYMELKLLCEESEVLIKNSLLREFLNEKLEM